jgi:hypothetical protein
MGSSASLDRSPRKNWVENSGGLPPYVREVARSIHNKRGVPLSRAISLAIGVMKRWAAGGGDVTAQTRAKAAKAVAQWEALKGRNKARSKTSHSVTGDVLALTSLPGDPMATCPSCSAPLALAAVPPQFLKNKGRKTPPATKTPATAKSTVQVPEGQEAQFKALAARIAKRPGMTREKAEKAAAAILRNRKGAKAS